MFGFYVRILELGMCLVCYESLSRLVVLVLFSSLRGICVGCIWVVLVLGGMRVWNCCDVLNVVGV